MPVQPYLERGISEEEGEDVLGQVYQGELPLPHTQVQDTEIIKILETSQWILILILFLRIHFSDY